MAALFGSRPGSWAAAPAHTVLGHVAVVRGRWDEAVSHLDTAADACARRGINNWSFQFEGDHVEALLAAGRREDAWRRMERLTTQAKRPHAIWPAMAGHRCRALLLAAEGRTIEARAEVREARAVAERLSPLEVGRCLLVAGAVERRAKQKRSARESFAAARDVFDGIGAYAWAERAAREGTRVGGRAPAEDDLTTTERRVVDLAVDGLRNREIAAALFISEHTVEPNLTRAYRKLGFGHARSCPARRKGPSPGGQVVMEAGAQPSTTVFGGGGQRAATRSGEPTPSVSRCRVLASSSRRFALLERAWDQAYDGVHP